mmetsp:Transcript_1413/g.4260  ORF Transcript_1413/g.4260 Transcript_1413/m.4260 type:complete len:318 (-) Transcript_1413:35-988(-)
MKVLLHYDDCIEDELKMTVKLTLPKKWLTGPAQRLVDTFVEAYNKKHPESALDENAVHFEKKDGFEVPFDAPVNSFMESGEDLYIKSGAGRTMQALDFTPPAADAPSAAPESKPKSSMAAAIAAADAKAAAAETPGAAEPSTSKGAGSEPRDGKVRCKRFGCKAWFSPEENSDTACCHHSKPPVFHETRKFWACCPEQIGWDWDSFQAIKGCCVGPHSDESQGQRFLGGSDVRRELEETQGTPQRLDAKRTGFEKLSALRRALVDLGVEPALFDRARDKLKTEHETGEANRVWDLVAEGIASKFGAVLAEVAGADKE